LTGKVRGFIFIYKTINKRELGLGALYIYKMG
jgi:hypothetical protein